MSRVDVAIVGAGFAGIGMAIALRRAGRESFVILERAASVGGTWRDNTYPGVACDVPSHLYGFAAHPFPGWAGFYARGEEIRTYLHSVVEQEQLNERLLFGTPMVSARWSRDRWIIECGGTNPQQVEANALVLACGRLTEPEIPVVQGLHGFLGPAMHTARWDDSVDLRGAHVAVIGTGASAVQLIPEIARIAARITLFQRTPAWIVPRAAYEYSDAERERFERRPEFIDSIRAQLYKDGEARFASRSGDPAAAADARTVALDHLRAQVADPRLRAALTPRYAFGCKRVLLSDDFYPAVASEDVRLEPSALVGVSGRQLVAASGSTYEVDVLVLATGFKSTRQPYASLVWGEDGHSLDEHWSTGMTSFGSTVVSGFPQMFVLNGPNASLGHNSSILMIEEQAAYVIRCLALRESVGVLRVDPAAERAYTDEIVLAAASTPWVSGGCRNWYVDERSGRLTLLWPGTVESFRSRLAQGRGSEFLGASRPRGENVHHGAAAPREGEPI